MPDQRAALPHQGMHAAQGMLPVVVGHVGPEDRIEKSTCGPQRRGVEVGGMGRAHLAHPEHPRNGAPPREDEWPDSIYGAEGGASRRRRRGERQEVARRRRRVIAAAPPAKASTSPSVLPAPIAASPHPNSSALCGSSIVRVPWLGAEIADGCDPEYCSRASAVSVARLESRASIVR